VIEEATLRELDEIVLVSKIFYDEMDFEKMGLSWDWITVRERIKGWIKSESAYVGAYKENGNILGVGILVLTPAMYNYNELIATEIVWHSLPGLSSYKRGKIMFTLLDKMIAWAKSKKAKTINLSVSLFKRNIAAAKFLKRQGFLLREFYFNKEI